MNIPAWAKGYIAVRHLEGEKWLTVQRLTYGRARLHLCTPREILESW